MPLPFASRIFKSKIFDEASVASRRLVVVNFNCILIVSSIHDFYFYTIKPKHMKTIHFILNFFMILIVSIAMFIIDLFLHIWNSGKEIFNDTVDNIKYAYSQRFN